MMQRRSTVGMLFAVAGLWLVSVSSAWAQEAKVARLLERLSSEGSVRVIVLGDSLTAGWTTWEPEREGFAQVLDQALQAQFPRCHIDTIPVGVPGQTSGDALRLLSRDVISREPDLLVIQLGGNDKGWGRRSEDLYRDLTEIVVTAQEETQAPIIVCTPPIVVDEGGVPFLAVVRTVAEENDVTLADLDAALTAWDHDYRGIFPWGEHPGSDVHLVMAQEIHRAFCAMTGIESDVTVSVQEQCRFVEPGLPAEVTVLAANTSLAPVSTELSIWVDGVETCATLDIAAGDEGLVSVPLPIPKRLPDDRAWRRRVFVTARTGEALAFDGAWPTLVPSALVEVVTEFDPLAPPQLPTSWRTELRGAQAVLGLPLWSGPFDLAGSFGLFCDDVNLFVVVEVTDDRLLPGEALDPTQGDLVEVWIDPRPSATQGRAAHSADVFGMFVIPNKFEPPTATWLTLDKTPAALEDAGAVSERTRTGYFAAMKIPLVAVGCEAPGELELRGIDIAIDDCDERGRDTQVMWTGGRDAFIDASLFAGLTINPAQASSFRLCVR